MSDQKLQGYIVRQSDLPLIPASHEDPVRPGVLKQVLLKKDNFINGHIQMLNWATLKAGSSFRKHYHEDMQEIYVIVKGCGTLTIGDDSFEVRPGDAAVIPATLPHEMTNNTDIDCEYLAFGIAGDSNGQTVVCQD